MSETEAMDISSPDSPTGDLPIPGTDTGLSNAKEPSQIAEQTNAAPSVAPPSDVQMDGTDSVLKPGIRLRDDVIGEADPNERPLKRARTLDTQVRISRLTLNRISTDARLF